MLTILIAIAVVVGLALLLRRTSERAATTALPAQTPDQILDEVGEGLDLEEDSGEAVAITSDGWAFVPHGHEVQMVPPEEPEDSFAPRQRLAGPRPGERLDVGDFIAARVARGAPGVDPWRLEVLRRDRDYHAFSFETEEAARAALELIERRIVRPPKDEHGDPVRLGAADFEAARREFEAGEAELAMAPEEDEEER